MSDGHRNEKEALQAVLKQDDDRIDAKRRWRDPGVSEPQY